MVLSGSDRLAAPRVFDGGQNVAAVCRGKIYVAGGAYSNGSKSAIVDVFDSTKLAFDPHLILSSGRSFLAVAALESAGLVFFEVENSEDEEHPQGSKDSNSERGGMIFTPMPSDVPDCLSCPSLPM